MDGVLNIRKEKGYTSFDVVAKLRGILHMKKIGHTGTLDPEAEGFLQGILPRLLFHLIDRSVFSPAALMRCLIRKTVVKIQTFIFLLRIHLVRNIAVNVAVFVPIIHETPGVIYFQPGLEVVVVHIYKIHRKEQKRCIRNCLKFILIHTLLLLSRIRRHVSSDGSGIPYSVWLPPLNFSTSLFIASGSTGGNDANGVLRIAVISFTSGYFSAYRRNPEPLTSSRSRFICSSIH